MVASLKFNSGPQAVLAALAAAHTLKLALTNTLPVITQTVFDPVTAHPPPASAGGYPPGGYTLTGLVATVVSTNQGALSANEISVAASGSDITPFRYGVLYIDDLPGKPVISFIDFGGTVTINDGDPAKTIDFSGTSPGIILSLA